MTDRRLTPANGRIAHLSLKGQVRADAYVPGEWARVIVPLANLLRSPDGPRDRQLLLGDRVLVLETRGRHAFVQAQKDGYCGYLALAVVGADVTPTHWVTAPATHLYATASIKHQEICSLSLGARLTIIAESAKFFETSDGVFVPRQHLLPVTETLDDPAHVAEMFFGTPYLWGGNSRAGIDCSGLVQAALLACGIACPGDSDQQFGALGRGLSPDESYRRGDLFFWKGHVAMAVDERRIIHANGYCMAVSYEGIADAIARIADEDGSAAFLGIRRL